MISREEEKRTQQDGADTVGHLHPREVSAVANAPHLTFPGDDPLFLERLERLDDEEWISAGAFFQTVENLSRNLLDLKHVMDQFGDLGAVESPE